MLKLTAQQQKEKLRRRVHVRKHTLLRRLCYKFVRDEVPELWEILRKEVGLVKPGRKKKKVHA